MRKQTPSPLLKGGYHVQGTTLLKGLTIVEEETTISNGYIVLKDGKIFETGTGTFSTIDEDLITYDFSSHSDYKAIPGFIDIHIHGVNGADMMDATEEALRTMCTSLPYEGTTAFLPTTITQKPEKIIKALKKVAQYQEEQSQNGGQAEIIGIHLEGPFISPSKAGAQPIEHIVEPSIEAFQLFNEAAGGWLIVITVAPELPNGINLVRVASSQGIIVSIGHTEASFEKVEEAVEAGAKHVTHLFNQMSGLHHRDPGVVGAALSMEQLKVEIICDGIHVHPLVVKATIAAKGVENVLLITDSMRAKGQPEGVFDLGGQAVTVKEGTALLADGTLAGSLLRMDEAVRNVKKWTGCSLRESVKMASENPAKQIGIFDRKGSIKVGKDADIVILNENNQVVMTICKGERAETGLD